MSDIELPYHKFSISFSMERGLTWSNRWYRLQAFAYYIKEYGWYKGLWHWIWQLAGRPLLKVVKLENS